MKPSRPQIKRMEQQKREKGTTMQEAIKKARKVRELFEVQERGIRNLRNFLGKETFEAENSLRTVLAKQVLQEFRDRIKKGERISVFDFGAGHGTLLLWAKERLGAKTGGAEIDEYLHRFSETQKLGVKRMNSANPELRRQGKQDLTFSLNFLEDIIIGDRKKIEATMDNIAEMTKKGGKSIHVLTTFGANGNLAVSKKDFEKRGFRIDYWGIAGNTPQTKYVFLIKATKIKD